VVTARDGWTLKTFSYPARLQNPNLFARKATRTNSRHV